MGCGEPIRVIWGYIGVIQGYIGYMGFRVSPKLGVPIIMENQMKKKMENEMETGFI